MRFSFGGKLVVINKEIIVPTFILVFTFLYFYDSRSLSDQALAFPKIIGITIGLCLIISIIKTIKVQTNNESPNTKEEPLISKKVAIFVSAFIIFMALLPLIGFALAVPIFLISMMLVMGSRNIKSLILVPGFVLGFIYIVFVYWLQISFPAASLW